MTVNNIAQVDSNFFLKSEYGPLGPEWPVVAFSQKSFETQIGRKYQTGRDFVVTLGTMGVETPPNDRGALISFAEIDLTKVYATYDFISEKSRTWAEKEYPGQWLRCFRVVRGFDVPARPKASEILSATDRNMWHVPFRQIAEQDLPALLKVEIVPINDVDILSRPGRKIDQSDLLRPENNLLSKEAIRLAQLVFNRVSISGQVVQHRAPMRSAPTDLQVQILALLMIKPLVCALCGGTMQPAATNKLLKISGDRDDSKNGDYGPENYQLVHTACNYAKNNATQAEFDEWITLVRSVCELSGENYDDK